MDLQCFVLSYNNFERTTQRCLDSLLPQIVQNHIKVTVGDNASPDKAGKQLEIYHSKFLLSHPTHSSFFNIKCFDQNFGFGGGMNLLTAETEAEWILLIGSDTIFPSGAITRLKKICEHAPPSFGIIAPVTNSAGTAQCLSFMGFSAEEIIEEWETLHSAYTGWLTPLYRADFFCVAIQTEVWRQLKGLDERYGRGYYEDFDFSLRVKKLGLDIAVAEDFFVYHEGSVSFSKAHSVSQLIKNNKKLLLSIHPNAELRHLRCDTLISIDTGISMLGHDHHFGARLNRLMNRLKLLESIPPKSILKKFIWALKRQYAKKKLYTYL